MTQALLFDFNGVLVNDEEQHRQALTTVLAAEGIAITRHDYYTHYLGFDDRMTFVEAFKRNHRTMTPALISHFVAAKSRAYLELLDAAFPVVSGAVAFVRAAAERCPLAIVSGALRAEIDIGLSRAGLDGLFETIVSAEDVRDSKPDPAGYLAACAALAVRRPLAARDCWVLEDSLPGLDAARAARMRVVGLTTSLDARQLAGADLVWPSFEGHDPMELLR